MKTALRVVVVVMVLAALGSIASAQEDVKGKGTVGQIPIWVGVHRIGDSGMNQNSDGSLSINGTSTTQIYGSTSNSENGAAAIFGSNTVSSGNTNGVSGLTASPDNSAGVQGTASAGVLSSGVMGVNLGASGGWGVKGVSQSPNSVGAEGDSPSVGIRGQSITCTSSGCAPQAGTAGQFVVGSGGTLLQGFVSAFNGPGGWTSVFRVDSTGFFDGGTQTSGADFAESVAVAKDSHLYEPGDLLVLDATADRQLKLSSEPYSTLVAGIYSTKPGVLATTHSIDAPATDKEVPLAIVGIVPCKVSSENGSIQRGDLLVTSPKPGYAMKGTDRSRMLGAVVGKAMEPLMSGTGTIQVLVTLQ